MRKIYSILVSVLLMTSFVGCSSGSEIKKAMPLESSQMKNICSLSVQKCYYHNVAKYEKKDAEGHLFWKKDRKFWIEYSGIVEIGIDSSLVDIKVDGENVTVSLPPAKVLNCKVDENTLNEDSFIIAKNSAKVGVKSQHEAFEEAQKNMEDSAKSDTVLLSNAEDKVKQLMEDYVKNVGECTGTEYKIEWKSVEDNQANDTVSISEETSES
ncbi:MAG: DUF4230 domain-containing protein [Oscillospiraceae bacterium]|nr:DUF4230 domain-containing protein [Oscillospiraceae bacterium]MDY3258161.1 DUF4230 domain-containing protein [Ruminococcus callidus]